MSKKTANAMCLIVAMVWGGGFIATSAALNTFQPFTVLMIRFVGAAIVCWAIVWFQKKKISRQVVKRSIWSGIFLYLAFAFQTFGLDLTETGMNAFLTAVNVVLVPYLTWMLTRKRPKAIQLVASMICFIGIGCLSLSSGSFNFRFGDVLSLICAFMFAAQIMATEYATQDADPMVVNAIQMSVAAVLAIPFALVFDTWPSVISFEAIGSVSYMILIATWLAYQLQTTAQKYTDASSASVLLCTECLFANIFGYLFLHETKTPIMIVGGLLIFVSVLLVESEGFFGLSKIKNDSKISDREMG